MTFSRISIALSTFALVSATAAFAAPKIGDSATMDGTLVGQGINAKIATSQKITAFDVNTAVYTIHQTQTVAGQTQEKDVQAKADDMMTEETAAMVVAGCESQQIGTKERVTVGAGAFDTCRVTTDNGSILWIGQVPFGVVKLQTAIDVGTVTLGATNFVRGN